MYGPSAATGVSGAAGMLAMTGSPVFAALAGFTLFCTALAVPRIVPAIRRSGRSRRG